MTRPPRRRRIALLALASGLTACGDAGVTSPAVSAAPSATAAPAPARLSAGAYYLRTVDGRSLPLALANGQRLESGFVVADSVDAGLVGWGESVGGPHSSAVRLTTGTARVLAELAPSSAQVVAISWRNAAASRDSVAWSRDSVVVHRSAPGLSAAGAGRRLVYTLATAADTL